MIESRGVATVAIGLVRPHIEKTRSPRGVWVPFPLGRPFGEPDDKAFQRRVLMQALALLERPRGPVLLEDFPDDAPSMTDRADWEPQVVLPPLQTPALADSAAWIAGMGAELTSVAPHWEAAKHRFGHTNVGLSRVGMDAWAPYLATFLRGEIPESPVASLSPALVARYIADDMKAFYMEAVQAIGQQPSGLQVNRWFWDGTLAAELLRALRTAALNSENNGFRTAGSRFIVPAPFVAKA